MGSLQVTNSAGLDLGEGNLMAVVTRCGCPSAEYALEHHAIDQLPCPTPRGSEDLGVISETRPNALRRWMKAARKSYRESRA